MGIRRRGGHRPLVDLCLPEAVTRPLHPLRRAYYAEDAPRADNMALTRTLHRPARTSRVKINHRARVDLVGAYSNRSDLRERLRRAMMILLDEASQGNEPDSSGDGGVRSTTRWWNLRDRFSPEDLQIMIDLYKTGTPAKQVAEKFSVSVRSVTRLLRQHSVRRDSRTGHP
jgi:hypothetical protein